VPSLPLLFVRRGYPSDSGSSYAELLAWRDGTDIVGAAYERILTGEQRRAAGQFYTPFWAGDLMAGWLFQKPRKLVLDPGVGPGALLITAARHPKRGKARLLGVDLDPLAATMLKANEGYLASKRKPWYAPEQRGDCPILFSYFNRAQPRFVRNRANAVPLNNWLIIEPKEGVDADVLYEALTSKAAMAQLEEGARVYGGGLWKLEPSELSEIRLN
jgi:SAM-dependent methyltransferase